MEDTETYCPLCQADDHDPQAKNCIYDGTPLRAKRDRGAEWIGKVVDGKYRVVRFVDAGGTAEVYEVERPGGGKRLALKLLHKSLSGDGELIESFRQEARLVSLIAHPNVVAIQDFGTLPGNLHYMVMELLAGRSLAAELDNRPMAPLRALRFAMQACEGLAAAHQREVLHCDIKPANFFLQVEGEGEPVLKILDLGIGRLVSAESSAGGRIAGTPDYMSPEQCRGLVLGQASEVYSMGVVLFEMLLGRMPFVADSPVELLEMHVSLPAEWPHALAAALGVPPEAEAVVMKALSKNPAERQASMLDLQQELGAVTRQIRAGSGAVVRPRVSKVPQSGRPSSPTPSVPPRGQRSAPPQGGVRETRAKPERAREAAVERTGSSIELGWRELAVRELLGTLGSGAASIASVMPRLLELLREIARADVSVLWIVDAKRPVLRCAGLSSVPVEGLAPFLAVTRSIEFAPGVDLPGRVWTSGRPLAIADVTGDRQFARASEAKEAGVHGVLALPLQVRGEVLGVLEFFTRPVRTADGDTIATVSAVAGEIGRSFSRGRVGEQLQAGVAPAEAEGRDATIPPAPAPIERGGHDGQAVVLEIWEGMLVLGLGGSLDAQRVVALTERLRGEIQRRRAGSVLIDASGLAVADDSTLEQLRLLARAVGESNVHCVLTGLRGLDATRAPSDGLPMFRTLVDGIAACMRERESRR